MLSADNIVFCCYLYVICCLWVDGDTMQAANCVAFSVDYKMKLEEKLAALERDAAKTRKAPKLENIFNVIKIT